MKMFYEICKQTETKEILHFDNGSFGTPRTIFLSAFDRFHDLNNKNKGIFLFLKNSSGRRGATPEKKNACFLTVNELNRLHCNIAVQKLFRQNECDRSKANFRRNRF